MRTCAGLRKVWVARKFPASEEDGERDGMRVCVLVCVCACSLAYTPAHAQQIPWAHADDACLGLTPPTATAPPTRTAAQPTTPRASHHKLMHHNFQHAQPCNPRHSGAHPHAGPARKVWRHGGRGTQPPRTPPRSPSVCTGQHTRHTCRTGRSRAHTRRATKTAPADTLMNAAAGACKSVTRRHNTIMAERCVRTGAAPGTLTVSSAAAGRSC